MQIPIIPHRGQKKPWNSIPRINWAHPLARNLVSYGYDVGCGPIDLVRGSLRAINNSLRITGIRSSQNGSGLLYLGGAAVTQANAVSLPTSSSVVTLTNAAPYSFACGTMLTVVPAARCTIFSTEDGGATPIQLSTFNASNTDFGFQFGNGTDQATASGFATLNIFHTLLGVALTGSTTACYVDGKLNISPAVTTTFTGAANTKPDFSGIFSTSQAFIDGHIYYGALWKNRALTAPEARKLHDDPYCFLIYPEDEIFAENVAVTTSAIFPLVPSWEPQPIQTKVITYG